jgi:RNA polymerase sigma-70 factor (ECF subfamily)
LISSTKTFLSHGKDTEETGFMLAFRRADQLAFSRVFDDLFGRLYVFCINLIRDEAEAEDVAIQSFTKLFDRHARFDSMAAIRAFLYITARNSCFDHLKKIKRLSARQREFVYLVRTDDEEMHHVQDYMDHMAALYDAMNQLPEHSRRVLEMIYLEGKKYSEVAEEFQISEDAAGNRRHYALKKLRELMAQNPVAVIWALEAVFIIHK